MSIDKKTKKTIKKTNEKLNIYGKNFNYIYEDKNRKHLSKLTNFLDDNEWLKVSKEKYHGFNFKIDKKSFKDRIHWKPSNVSWFSKGSWIFHMDNCCNFDDEIIYITVDYKNIYKIANKSPYSDLSSNDDYKSKLSKFNKEYIVKHKTTRNILVNKEDKFSDCNFIKSEEGCGYKKTNNNNNNNNNGSLENFKWENNCKWNKKTNKCEYRHCSKKKDNCATIYKTQIYDWTKLLKKYDGMAIYPMMTEEEMEKIQNHHGFDVWDVETLVLSNDAPIITHHNLGTIRELLNITKKEEKETKENQFGFVDINYSKLVSKLIQKINEVRKL
jgi:hypothetical protein